MLPNTLLRRSSLAVQARILELIGELPGSSVSSLLKRDAKLPRKATRGNLDSFEAAGLVYRGMAAKVARGLPAPFGYYLSPVGMVVSQSYRDLVQVIGESLHPVTVRRVLRWYQWYQKENGSSLNAMRNGEAGWTRLEWSAVERYTVALSEAGLLEETQPSTRRFRVTQTGADWLTSIARIPREVLEPLPESMRFSSMPFASGGSPIGVS